jgi:flavin-binding protein dodecin
MANVLKVIEVLGESSNSFEDAVTSAVEETTKSVRNVKSAYVREQTVTVKDGKIDKYRVNVKITFEVDMSKPQNA